MYVSIGHESVVKASELILIMDFNTYADSELNQQWKLTPAAEDTQYDNESHKSVVITTTGLYFSPLSSATLQKRLKFTHQNKLNDIFG
ncbi:DUF370 domain-containing protein [Bacillus sp. AGMB 02131]|uniref:DUF370 domain-containing protein n=1 Tax=Peribacillus faecalis TaxID=2772559 RepID=A0A927D1H8_9BACI|nr:extracellular matrix/biofilm biosynthesis regulator RemA family protein [Peribacillus faecalis]MBD3109319.1 DUF370 domain-containing protein [Peribacillus faecalis]